LGKVVAALKTSAVVHARDAEAFFTAILPRSYNKEACVVLDLSTVVDAERIITFTKSSPSIKGLPIVALGTEDEHDALSQEAQLAINGVIVAPYSAGEVAAVMASICEHPLPEIPAVEPRSSQAA
jgi:hypothetical protein